MREHTRSSQRSFEVPRNPETSQKRPESALYLRLQIVKGGQFRIRETPVVCKIRKELKRYPCEIFEIPEKNFDKKDKSSQ